MPLCTDCELKFIHVDNFYCNYQLCSFKIILMLNIIFNWLIFVVLFNLFRSDSTKFQEKSMKWKKKLMMRCGYTSRILRRLLRVIGKIEKDGYRVGMIYWLMTVQVLDLRITAEFTNIYIKKKKKKSKDKCIYNKKIKKKKLIEVKLK